MREVLVLCILIRVLIYFIHSPYFVRGDTICRNTESGRWNLTDETGRVCQRDEIDFSTGCCPSTKEKNTCASCMERDGCCSSYENCVSCCMSPENSPGERMKETYIGLHKSDTGHWSNEFDYCRAACRTTSRSTDHENAYIGERRFCFSEERRPRSTDHIELDVGEFVAGGEVDKSCNDLCALKQGSCSHGSMQKINNCDELRMYYPCEAGCEVIDDDTSPFPGYMAAKIATSDNPAKCFAVSESAPLSCSTKSDKIHRLCVCLREKPRNTDMEGTAQ